MNVSDLARSVKLDERSVLYSGFHVLGRVGSEGGKIEKNRFRFGLGKHQNSADLVSRVRLPKAQNWDFVQLHLSFFDSTFGERLVLARRNIAFFRLSFR